MIHSPLSERSRFTPVIKDADIAEDTKKAINVFCTPNIADRPASTIRPGITNSIKPINFLI
tara:strand:+ start:952 stop:1134 length:183 start_codon:yes stop_codon:yes gene_type:complete